ncbi:hypothetical protein M9458_027828, partial [Cirrhinus mrigala]
MDPSATISPPSASPMARPATYSGDAAMCSGFLLQCSLYFELHPHQFANDQAKVTFIISLLAGRALQWVDALWNSESPLICSLSGFMEHFKEDFSQATTEISAHDELLRLRQANLTTHDYTLRFRTLAASSRWNETALFAAYLRGLNPLLRQHMAIYEDSVSLESFLQKASHISQHMELHYEYWVMTYGLSNSPSIFQNFMNEIFRLMLNQFVIIYIDNILIYSPSLQDHHRHVTQVLQRLREHHLYLKPGMCEFHKTTIHFLGYIMDQRKVDAMWNWPLPTTIKEMQRFLGQAFQDLKQAFCAAPAFTHPDPNIRFVVEWAPFCPNGEVNPLYAIHVCSSLRNCPRRNKITTSGGIGWRVPSFHSKLNPHQARWALFFTRFHFTITYRPGNKNTKADALSRLHQPDPQPDEQESILPTSVFVSPITWALDSQIEGKTFVPTSLRHALLEELLNPLAPQEPLLVAQHGPGCHSICQRMFGLRHHLNTSSSAQGQA